MAVPTDIANLFGWWKADAIGGLSDNDPVGTWSDSSGATNDMTQGTAANKPLYKTNQINSLPAVKFDGTNDFLSGTGQTGDDFTMFLIFASSTTSGCMVLNGDGDGYGFSLFSGRNMLYRLVSDNSAGVYTANTWEVWSGTRDTGSGQTGTLYKDGTSVVTTTDDPVTPTANLLFGKLDSGDYSGVSIAEFFIYTRKLSSTERAQMHSYLQDKYGISVSDYISSSTPSRMMTGYGT